MFTTDKDAAAGEKVIRNQLPETRLLTSDFDYELPPELIAQHPAEPRDSARLMVVDRASGEVSHSVFREIGDFLSPGDTLVINDSKVIPARVRKQQGADEQTDVEPLQPLSEAHRECLQDPLTPSLEIRLAPILPGSFPELLRDRSRALRAGL